MREKISWSTLASAWEDFLLFLLLRGDGGKEVNEGLPTLLFLFVFVRHACQKLNCRSTQSINMMMRQGYNPVLLPGNHHQISVTFHLLLLHHQSTIQIEASPLPLLQKICISCTNWRQSIPVAKHQTDYPVSISLVTEIHVSVHILHNLLIVPVVVTC